MYVCETNTKPKCRVGSGAAVHICVSAFQQMKTVPVLQVLLKSAFGKSHCSVPFYCHNSSANRDTRLPRVNLPLLSLINLKMPSSEQASIKLTCIRGSSIVVFFFFFTVSVHHACACTRFCSYPVFSSGGFKSSVHVSFLQTSGLEWGHAVIYLSRPGLENLTHCTFSSQKQVLSFICSFGHDAQFNISAIFSSVSHGKVIFFFLLL